MTSIRSVSEEGWRWKAIAVAWRPGSEAGIAFEKSGGSHAVLRSKSVYKS